MLKAALELESTPTAKILMRKLAEKNGQTLILVMGGGCCDNTAPQLYKDFIAGPTMEKSGEIEGVPVYFESQLLRAYVGSIFVLDASPISGPSDSFSLETTEGYRFRFYLRKQD